LAHKKAAMIIKKPPPWMSTRGLVGKINTPRVAAVRSLAAPIDVTPDYLNNSAHFSKLNYLIGNFNFVYASFTYQDVSYIKLDMF
jgi:hypothetical protein